MRNASAHDWVLCALASALLEGSALAAPPKPAPPSSAPSAKTKASPAANPFVGAEAALLAAGVVVLERAGSAIALGTVINGDGRVITALSALGDARNLDARYSDGSVVPVRLGHAHKARDLALVVPQNARHQQGLRASREAAVPTGALRPFVPAGKKAMLAAAVTPAREAALYGADGKPLVDAIAFTAPLRSLSAGTPLLDSSAEVVAIATQAFRRVPGAGTGPVLVGTPVSVIREFLKGAPATAALPIGGIGVQGEVVDAGVARGVRVMGVRGPAAAAGLHPGKDLLSADVIVAIDGVPVITPDALITAVSERSIGDAVDLLVLGGGRYRHVTLVVAPGAR